MADTVKSFQSFGAKILAFKGQPNPRLKQGALKVCQAKALKNVVGLKGTVSPDIGLRFSFWKIIFVLSAGLPMVLTFFYFVVPEIFIN